jgi:acyl-CoA reductase-like NAD-dependent aldehyde dehydrogenase
VGLQSVLEELQQRPGTGDVIRIIDPATEEQIAEFSDGGVAAVDAAVSRARSSFEAGVWNAKPGNERAKVLWRIAELIDEHAADLAEIDSVNTGMPYSQAHMIMSTSAEVFRYYGGWCTKVNGIAHDIQMTGGISGAHSNLHAYTLKEPYGVVGLIFPWNGPVFNACTKLAPALAAGCSSVVKPAEETPLSALFLMRLLKRAGVPGNRIRPYRGCSLVRAPRCREDRLHWVNGSRQADRAVLGGQPQARRPGTWGKVSRSHLRRRRPADGHHDGGDGHLHSLGPGVHQWVAHLRPTRCLRAGRRRHCRRG